MNRLFLLFIFCPFLSFSQPVLHKYFIGFTDKNGSAFSASNPSAFLSPRAISRRISQGIPVTGQDFPVNENYVNNVRALGAIVLAKSKWFNGITIECDSSVLSSILNLPYVLNSKLVYRLPKRGISKVFSKDVSMNPRSFNNAMSNDYGSSFNQLHLMNGEFLHEQGYWGDGMLIALLDDGFYSVDHLPAFDIIRSRNQILSTWDFVSGDASVYDDDSHGMSVLSTIAGNVPGQILGTAPDASFLLLRSEDAATENIIEEYNWNVAAEFADSAGADIISSSLGYTEFDDSLSNHTYADMDGRHCPSSIAADIAASKGMLVITSAGNSGDKPWHYIGAPTDAVNVLTVGAVDSSGHYAFFSSVGPSSDGRVKPNLVAKGYKSTIAESWGGIATGSGTSFACPELAGSAACLWQAFPGLSANKIKSAIERSGNSYSSPNDSMGYGIPDFRLAKYYLTTSESSLLLSDEITGIYPNPFSETVNIDFFSATSQSVLLEMINTIGQIIYSSKSNVIAGSMNTFSISNNKNIPSGVYFVRVSTPVKSFVKRVVRY